MSECATCPKPRCRAVLRLFTDRLGRVMAVCDDCDRRRMRRCRTQACQASVTGKQWYCRPCAAARQRERDRAYRTANRAEVRVRKTTRQRERYRTDPAYRAYRMAASRAYTAWTPARCGHPITAEPTRELPEER